MIMLTPLQRFFMMLAPNGKAIKNLYIFAIVSGIISLSLPLGIQAIINLIQGGEVSASWILLVSIVIFGYTFNGFLQIMQLRITEDLQKDIFARSAFEFTYRLPRIKTKALYDHYPPEQWLSQNINTRLLSGWKRLPKPVIPLNCQVHLLYHLIKLIHL
ncbi:MAG: hypothetical protein IPO92_22600 [Saprospiraceae bacterium]|nr:hypothetical protein [Saprospiraceae bacterium]